MKPSWIIFDVGGVLLDWQTSSAKTAEWLGISRDELFDVLFDQTVEKSIGGLMDIGQISAQDGWTKVLHHLQSDHTPDEVIAHWYAAQFWLEDSLKLLTELKSHGYRLAIMSNSWLGLGGAKNRRILPRELQLFDKIFDSSQEKMQKPYTAFYELVERNTAMSSSELLFIDDDESNIKTAASRGWQTFLYDQGEDKGIGANDTLRRKLL